VNPMGIRGEALGGRMRGRARLCELLGLLSSLLAWLGGGEVGRRHLLRRETEAREEGERRRALVAGPCSQWHGKRKRRQPRRRISQGNWDARGLLLRGPRGRGSGLRWPFALFNFYLISLLVYNYSIFI